MIVPVRFRRGVLELVDQTLLPGELRWIQIADTEGLAEAIYALRVRGAPAIGIAAAYGLALAAGSLPEDVDPLPELQAHHERLASTRPTAVNLRWALDRMLAVAARAVAEGENVASALSCAARRLHATEIRANRTIGILGAELLPEGATILTHCNTGALATGGYGTALGVVCSAWRRGKLRAVLVDETRPLLQGARLTAWELGEEGIPYQVIVDSAAGSLLARGAADAVLVGADRIARNGDVANKIGSYPLAVLARRHGVPYYSVAPTSTIDPALQTGAEIPIEERPEEEILTLHGVRTAPADAAATNPAFDVVPHDLIDGIITEAGVLRPPFEEAIDRVFA